MEQRTHLESKKYKSKAFIKFKKKYSGNLFFNILKMLKNLLVYCVWRLKIYKRKQSALFDFDKIYWVNPADIVYCTIKEFNPFKCDGLTLSGNWDISDKKFEDLDVFQAFNDHFIKGLNWEKTDFYQQVKHSISKGNFHWGCCSETDFFERCQKLSKLYQSIAEQGYKLQTKNITGFAGRNSIDEVSVNLDRNGNLLFNNGAHRLSIAKILNIKTIPVRVTVCHKDCHDFKILKGEK